MSEADLDPLRYRPPVSDAGRVMDSLAALHLKVDAGNRVLLKILELLPEASDPDPDAEDVRTLDGGPAGQERDSTRPL